MPRSLVKPVAITAMLTFSFTSHYWSLKSIIQCGWVREVSLELACAFKMLVDLRRHFGK